MKTTVVIPNYNGKQYLEKCLLSLQQCKNTHFEIIVVDNGSTDGSVELINKQFPTVKSIFLSHNTGFAKAVNIGLKEVSTNYVLLLNNDIVVESDFVDQMEKAMERHPNGFAVNSRMLSMSNHSLLDGAGDLYCALGWAFALGKGKDKQCNYLKEAKIFSACGGASIYRMDILKIIGYFDENHFAYLEDVDLGYRAKIYGYGSFYTPDAICYHMGSAFSGSRYNEFKVKLSSRNSVYLILKNMPLLQILLNLPFLFIGFFIKILFFLKKGMGKLYLKGLMDGFRLFFSKKGHNNKVKFQWKHMRFYIQIQFELWLNIIRRVFG